MLHFWGFFSTISLVVSHAVCTRWLFWLLLQLLTCKTDCFIFAVTTTNQAVVALRMLRQNRDLFDLVISDVHMPDMDGFKLLELVGLEMDLPVISKSKKAISCWCPTHTVVDSNMQLLFNEYSYICKASMPYSKSQACIRGWQNFEC